MRFGYSASRSIKLDPWSAPSLLAPSLLNFLAASAMSPPECPSLPRVALALLPRRAAQQSGRGGGIRTPTLGFGDRWSTVEPTPLRMFHFLVRGVFAARIAKLLRLEPL